MGKVNRRRQVQCAEAVEPVVESDARPPTTPVEIRVHEVTAKVRVCDQVELDAAVNVITRAMLRTFTGIAIDGQSLPTVFVASAEVAAELERRWNSTEMAS